MSRKPAVFLYRDGTLTEDGCIPGDPENITLLQNTVPSLLRLQEKYSLFMVTNQSEADREQITGEKAENVNQHLAAMLTAEGVNIKKWYHCKSIEQTPAFLLQAAEEFNLSLSRSFIIGNHPHDISAGESIGVFGLYVLTGHGKKYTETLPPEKPTFHIPGDAVEWILNHPDSEKDIHRNISKGADAVRRGKLVVFPTETVYGLGADALNPSAVAEIFKVKKRPLSDPLIVHVSDKQQVKSLVNDLSAKAELLIENFWPGPLSLVLPKSLQVPDIVTAGNHTVAVRMPNNPWTLKLIHLAGTPLAAPSANLFGYTSPTTAKHVREQLEGKYNVLIDGGACRVGVESTVLSLINDIPVLLRPGGVSIDEIRSIIGPVQIRGNNNLPNPQSPGMMTSHYSTDTPLVVYPEIPKKLEKDPHTGFILFGPPEKDFTGPVEVLSKHHILREAAVNLYAAMRRLDSMDLRLIAAHRFPDCGLGTAINDRLGKASGKK